MKIYTSYFGNAKNLTRNGIRMIGVALGRPKFLPNVPQLRCVCPTPFMLTAACSMEEYLRRYDEILSRLDAWGVMSQIQSLSGGRDVALCCYEKPGDFCHRHLLAKWLTGKTGTEIMEYGGEKNRQLELF